MDWHPGFLGLMIGNNNKELELWMIELSKIDVVSMEENLEEDLPHEFE